MSRARDVASLLNSDSKIEREKFEDTRVVGRRNILINGAMQVAQRATSKSSVSTHDYHTVDRWDYYPASAGSGVVTLSQSTDAPDGFANSLKVDVTTAEASLNVESDYRLRNIIEAQDLQRLNYGSQDAKSITISFWVKSSKTGTYTFNIYEADSARTVGAEYTIDSASTWEKKVITIAGDTGGSINNDNGPSMYLQWVLATGSNNYGGTFATSWEDYNRPDYFSSNQANLFDSTNNDWYITGVQLEVGDIATPFEHRSYAEELTLCHRYYIERFTSTADQYGNIWTGDTGADTYYHSHPLPVDMRANPTVTATSAGKSSGFGTLIVSNGSKQSVSVRSAHTGTATRAYFYWGFKADAEL